MLDKAIRNLRQELNQFGEPISTPNWQGMENPPEFLEVLNVSFEAKIPDEIDEIRRQCNPFLPWADEHFEERVSGLPLIVLVLVFYILSRIKN